MPPASEDQAEGAERTPEPPKNRTGEVRRTRLCPGPMGGMPPPRSIIRDTRR
jgi:hypothetical protein